MSPNLALIFSIFLLSPVYGLKCLVCDGIQDGEDLDNAACFEGNSKLLKTCEKIQDADLSTVSIYPGIDLSQLTTTCGKRVQNFPNNKLLLKRSCMIVPKDSKREDLNSCKDTTIYSTSSEIETLLKDVGAIQQGSQPLQVTQTLCTCNDGDGCNSAGILSPISFIFIAIYALFANFL